MSELYAVIIVIVGIVLGCLIMSGCFSLINIFNIYRQCLWQDISNLPCSSSFNPDQEFAYDLEVSPHILVVKIKTTKGASYTYSYRYFFLTTTSLKDNALECILKAKQAFTAEMAAIQETLDQTEGTKDNV